MKKQWKRLVVAAVCSSSVFAGTYSWYKSTDQTSSAHGNEKPLAYVGKVVDDIQRRPATRLLWQLVNQGEPLYNGEAVRTSEHGEVRIQFTDSDRYLDLEPESLIVIKKSEGEIALDLMEGSLFVDAKAGAAGDAPGTMGLVLSSANGKVDLSKAAATLSKGHGNAVDIQILDGQASLKGKDGKNKELTTGSFGAFDAGGMDFNKNNLKVLSPLQHKPIAMDAENIKDIPFQWTGFPANAEVALWVGPTRKEIHFLTKAVAGKSEVLTKLPFGKHYWKLIATTPQGQIVGESSIYKIEVVARYAPTVVFPTSNAEIPANTNPFDMSFKWQKGDETRSVTLEVWSDSELKHQITKKSFSDEENYTLPALKSGTYFWRMSSYYVDSDKPLFGKIQKFSVKPVEQVHLDVKKEVIPVNVAFTMPENKPFYYIDTPQVGLSWNADKTEQVSAYRVKLLGENEDPASAISLDIKENKVTTPVPKPGRYIASIDALDKDGQVLGTSTSRPLDVTPLPIISAPRFLPAQGLLQADPDGRSRLEWTSVEGAKEYWLTIKKDGKELKHSKYNGNTTALRNLLPGEYDVEISAVDSYGRSSEVNPARKLLVPDKSGLRAPSLKKIKVN